MRLMTSVCLIVPAVVFLGCDGGDTLQPPGDELELAGLDFLLDSSEGFTPVASSTVRVGFYESGGTLNMSGSAGCNSFDATISLENSVMSTSVWSMTDMGCSQALMDQDSWLVEFFSDKPTLSLEGDYLTFAGASATLIFMDSEVAIPDRVLVGSTWTVDTFIDGETASTSNLEEYPTLLFNENGTVEVFTGCNDGDGRYTVSGDQLTFSSLSYTRRSCANEVVASAEYHVMGVLAESDLTFGIDATRLTIQSLTIGLSATTD